MPVLTAWQMKATSTIHQPWKIGAFRGVSPRLILFHPVSENGSLTVAWRSAERVLPCMPRIRLVDATVRAVQPPARGQVNYIDVTLPGFSLRVAAGGAKRWIVTYH